MAVTFITQNTFLSLLKEKNKEILVQQPYFKNNTDNNDIVKPYTEIKRQKDIFKVLEKCDKVLDAVPKIIKSNVQFVLNTTITFQIVKKHSDFMMIVESGTTIAKVIRYLFIRIQVLLKFLQHVLLGH